MNIIMFIFIIMGWYRLESQIPKKQVDHYHLTLVIWLVVYLPSEKYESQIGSSSQLLANVKKMFQTTNQISYWGCIPVNKWATTRLLWISPLPHGSMGCYFRYLLNDDQGNVIFAFGLKAPWRGNVHRWQKNYWVIKCNKCIRWMDGWMDG
jgi:hypothetical protein